MILNVILNIKINLNNNITIYYINILKNLVPWQNMQHGCRRHQIFFFNKFRC